MEATITRTAKQFGRTRWVPARQYDLRVRVHVSALMADRIGNLTWADGRHKITARQKNQMVIKYLP